jgi:hypothetical protein
MRSAFSATIDYLHRHNLSIEQNLLEPAAANLRIPKEKPSPCPACGGDNVAHCPWDNCYLKARNADGPPEPALPH